MLWPTVIQLTDYLHHVLGLYSGERGAKASSPFPHPGQPTNREPVTDQEQVILDLELLKAA